MPQRAAWEATYSTGHPTLDAQHQALLDQCKRLADLCGALGSEAGDTAFDAAFSQLKDLAREHFETEASLLAGDPERLEDPHSEREAFDHLVAEIATAQNFSRLELQRFLTLWCVGHIAGFAQRPLRSP